MVPELVLAAALVFLQKEIHCLKNVDLIIEPRVVEKGGDSILTCEYNLESVPLYTVKWYRGHHEFYRYTPNENPRKKIFPFDGIKVDLEQSNEHQVVLTEVGFNLSGKFSCEVTTDDAPSFSTLTVYKNMLVVVLPNNSATLTTDRSNYDIGDILRANCSSPPSRPPATLTFLLNNIVVCEKCVTKKHPKGELSWSVSSLELPLFPSHFNNGRLTVKCIAKIGDFYEQDSEITFDNAKDPVPARVTQSSSQRQHNGTIGMGLLIVWCLLFL